MKQTNKHHKHVAYPHADLRRYTAAKRKFNRSLYMYIGIVATFLLLVGIRLAFFTPPLDFSLDKTPGGPNTFFLAPGVFDSAENGQANVTIFDSTDLNQVRFSGTQITFYANYTLPDGTPIDELTGACSLLAYDLTGAGGPQYVETVPMQYGSSQWSYTNTSGFEYKGNHLFSVNCSSPSLGGDLLLSNDFLISNTAPEINVSPSGILEFDGNQFTTDTLACTEDALCVFDASVVVSEPDLNDVLTYSYIAANTTLTDFVLDSSTGLLEILVTSDAFTGNKDFELSVQDNPFAPYQPVAARDTGILQVAITPVNDPPQFLNLANQTFNRSELFEYSLLIEDEEDNVPISYTITFLECSLPDWSPRINQLAPGDNCTLFTEADYTYDSTTYDAGGSFEIGSMFSFSFIPERSDVGDYLIEINVTDSGSPNATSTALINFSVSNINENPFFTQECGLVTAVEDVEATCLINATDYFEPSNLTFVADPTWFLPLTTVDVNAMTNYAGWVLVSFTPTDSEVGTWDINISVTDTESPVLSNYSILPDFEVQNVNDPVILTNLSDPFVAYTSNTYVISINATDDDLLIPFEGGGYQEGLTFTVSESWISVQSSTHFPGTNRVLLSLFLDPSAIPGPDGIYYAQIGVEDANAFSQDSILLPIQKISNNAPMWDPGTPTDYALTEDVPFYLNLSQWVIPGDEVYEFFISSSVFPTFDSFAYDPATGVIDFIPQDLDVGAHIFEINVTDNIASQGLVFNFTVENINDLPVFIDTQLLENATVGSQGTIFLAEDTNSIVTFFLEDDDLQIPFTQSAYYNEDYTFSVNVTGPNTTIFSFARDYSYPQLPDINQTRTFMTLLPRKPHVGNYTINITATDASGALASKRFNLTITEVEHDPFLDALQAQGTIANLTVTYDINATDLEDGDDSDGLLTYSYFFESGADFILANESIFNTTSGLLNFTPTDTDVGSYVINITVSDTAGRKDSDLLYFTIYNPPIILLPPEGWPGFVMVEGVPFDVTFAANASVDAQIVYDFFVLNISRTDFVGPGNGTAFVQAVTAGYGDESYGELTNVSLVVSIPGFPHINATRTWQANISHNNSPVTFYNEIPDIEVGYGTPYVLNLRNYFSDPDYFDPVYNQTVNITIIPNSTGSGISASVDTNWLASFSASGLTQETYYVTMTDYDLVTGLNPLTSATSNNFTITFVEPLTVPQPVPEPDSGGGSGGSGQAPQKPQVIELLVPGIVEINENDQVIVPLTLRNTGQTFLSGIDLLGTLFVNGELYDAVFIDFTQDFIPGLNPGQEENITLTVDLAGVPEGLYAIEVNVTVSNPPLTDWGRILIVPDESSSFTDRLVFVDDLIVANPECVELQELVVRAQEAYDAGDTVEADLRLNEAINACRDAISQRSIFSRNRLTQTLEDKIFRYLVITTIVALVLGIIYYVYRRIEFMRTMKQQAVVEDEDELLLSG